MTTKFKKAIKERIKQKHKKFHDLVKEICGRRLKNNKYYIHSGNLV